MRFYFVVTGIKINPLGATLTKWSHTQTIRRLLPTNCFSVFKGYLRYKTIFCRKAALYV